MTTEQQQATWLRELVDFALDNDVSDEIARQREIVAAQPDSSRARFDLGVLHYSQGRIYDAIGEFLMAVEIDPLYSQAYRKLGEIYVNLGDYRQAGSYALKAAELGDTSLFDAFRRYPAMRGFVEAN